MGMFDSLYGSQPGEWQTKAFGRGMHRFKLGDPIPSPLRDFQVEVIGGNDRKKAEWRLATVKDGRLDAVPARRDKRLPVVSNFGERVAEPGQAFPARTFGPFPASVKMRSGCESGSQ